MCKRRVSLKAHRAAAMAAMAAAPSLRIAVVGDVVTVLLVPFPLGFMLRFYFSFLRIFPCISVTGDWIAFLRALACKLAVQLPKDWCCGMATSQIDTMARCSVMISLK